MQVLVGNNYGSYVFNPAAQTITLSGLPATFAQAQLKLIINTISNTIIFNLADPTMTASISGNVITLTFNTTAMNASDPLQIFLEVPGEFVSHGQTTQIPQLVAIAGLTNDVTPQYQEIPLGASGASVIVSSLDNTVLANIASVSTTGAGSSYSTTGYQTISFQLNGQWSGGICIENSNDNTNWFSTTEQNATDGVNTDIIYENGIYTVAVASIYVRYNVIKISGTVSIVVIGKIAVQDDSSLVAQAYDSTSGVAQNVILAGGLKVDASNAVLLSDCYGPIIIRQAIGNNFILDCIGYQSFHVSSPVYQATMSCSNDLITWSTVSGISTNTLGQTVGYLTAGTSIIVPVTARYLKFTCNIAGIATGFLRNSCAPISGVSINFIGGQSVAIPGLGGSGNGIFGVAGSAPIGSTTLAWPVATGGADPSGLIRRLLLDTSGRTITAADQFGISRILGTLSPPSSQQNIPVLAVNNVASTDGQSEPEILLQILTELKILNYYMFNLPTLLNAGSINTISDEPGVIRNLNDISSNFE